MKSFRLLSIPFFLLLSLLHGAESPRIRECFDESWQFHFGEMPDAQKKSFDSKSWRTLDLPHDLSVERGFDAKSPVAAPGGYLHGGIGWYRKSFRLPSSAAGKKISIEFDGAYMNTEVWINDHYLGKRPYGYIGFAYDLTPHLDRSGENTIAVKVDNSKVPSGRWYAGTGIYRHVWLSITDPLHITHWGTSVTTPEITAQHAIVSISSTIRNDHATAKTVKIKHSIIDATTNPMANIAIREQDISITANQELTHDQSIKLHNPKTWSPTSPNLYQIRTEVFDGDRLADVYFSPLGIREIRFDSQKGLTINGESIKMKGVCNHQDLGPLGSALWDQALERRLKILKDMGCNAIRTAHYPHSPELMHLCDKLGFLVLDETFDEWRRGWAFEGDLLVSSKNNKGKAPFGYNKYFDEWHERDLTDHIMRDRNHPCVIMWSMGNELPESVKNGEIDTVKRMRELYHKLDPTRPVTVGCNHMKSANESGFTELLDIVGYNEGVDSIFEIEGDRTRYPNRLMYLSELPHSLQTRGEYRTQPRYFRPGFDHPKLTEKEIFPETDAHYDSSYDNAGVQTDARRSWRLTSTDPKIMGEFRWTGFDYIGESGGWPRVLGNFGIIDLCHFPKDTYFFYQSQWTEKPMAHLLPHWTWPSKVGTTIPVWCYTNCHEAELFLNGQSLGKKSFDQKNDMHLEWLVPWQPGEIKVLAYRDGKLAATSSHKTAGAPAKIAVTADQQTLNPDTRDLSYLSISMQDENGNFAPKAANWVTVKIEGPARLLGTGAGDPLSQTNFQANTFRTFNGLGLAIITATKGKDEGGKKGNPRKANEIIVTIASKGMPPATVHLTRTDEGKINTLITPATNATGEEIGVDGLPVRK